MATARSAVATLLCLLLLGCGTGAGSTTPGETEPGASAVASAATERPSPGATESAGASPASGWRATVVGDEPIIDGPAIEGVAHLLAGAFVADGSTVHGWVVGFGAAIGDQSVLHLSWDAGPDSIAQVDEPVIDLGIELADPGPIPTSVMQLPDGSFAMFGSGTASAQPSEPTLWRATAATLGGPWAADPGVILEPRDPPAWDSSKVDFPAVIPSASGSQRMVYEGASAAEPDASHIGVAESADGIAWTRDDAPVVAPGHCGSGDGVSVFMPRAMALQRGLVVAYLGTDGSTTGGSIFLSAGDAAASWTCQDPAPLLGSDAFIRSGGMHSFAAYEIDGVALLVVEVLSEDFATSALWLVRLEPPAS